MLFRRRNAKTAGTKAAANTSGRTKPKAAAATSKAAKPGSGATAAGKAGAKAGGSGGKSAERAAAERQILQRLSDGSAEQQRRLAALKDADEVFDRYPRETASLLRSWLTGGKH